MGKWQSKFDGRVVAEPEERQVGQSRVLQFPVYVNERRKNRDTGEYEDSGTVSKIRVQLWNDAIDTADIRKGDVVEVEAATVEVEFQKRDGTTGRQVETRYVDSITLLYRQEESGAPKATGFDDGEDAWATPGGGF